MSALSRGDGARRPIAAALLAAAVGLGTLGSAAPAAAATAPTIDQPAIRTGFGPITITGTAPPGATVTLIEAAYVFRTDMYPAPNYDKGGIVTAVADSTGHYAIERNMDSGFVFAVEAGGVRSRVITVGIHVLPAIALSADGKGTVQVRVEANPDEPGLPVQVQRAGSGGTWTTLKSGSTGSTGAYSTVLTGEGTGTHRYRAYIGGDPENAVLGNYSATLDTTGAVISPAPTTPATAPPTSPASVKPGDVQFTKIVYNSPGSDTGSNASLNGEYVRLTNKTKRTVDLANWTIRDVAGHIYRISGTHLLGAGKTLYLHTGKGTTGSVHLYWGRTGYVWNNGGDTAILRTATDRTIDSCKWGAGSGTTYC